MYLCCMYIYALSGLSLSQQASCCPLQTGAAAGKRHTGHVRLSAHSIWQVTSQVRSYADTSSSIQPAARATAVSCQQEVPSAAPSCPSPVSSLEITCITFSGKLPAVWRIAQGCKLEKSVENKVQGKAKTNRHSYEYSHTRTLHSSRFAHRQNRHFRTWLIRIGPWPQLECRIHYWEDSLFFPLTSRMICTLLDRDSDKEKSANLMRVEYEDESIWNASEVPTASQPFDNKWCIKKSIINL